MMRISINQFREQKSPINACPFSDIGLIAYSQRVDGGSVFLRYKCLDG